MKLLYRILCLSLCTSPYVFSQQADLDYNKLGLRSNFDQPAAAQDYTLIEFAADVKDAMGTFSSVPVFKQKDDNTWSLLSGQYIPITVNGQTPAHYTSGMKSDRPIMLPLHGFNDGQSVPYSVVGRIAGSNPEVQWVWIVRQYTIKNPDTPSTNFDMSGDVALIGHHPRTGAAAYFQYYGPSSPKSAKTIPDPWSNPTGAKAFWDTPARTASNGCASCHNADPFVHSPYIQEPKLASNDPVVPSNPLGPYWYVGAKPGQAFNGWNTSYPIKHLDDNANQCVQCHRISPYDGAKLNKNSIRTYTDPNQTTAYQNLHWMSPVYPQSGNFYDGQAGANAYWDTIYSASAYTVNNLTVSSHNLADISNPPTQYQTILVDRPNQDAIPASSSIWVVDTRMRANLDTDIGTWQFKPKGTDATVSAAPVVYRLLDENSATFKVIFVGEPRFLANGNTWVNFNGNGSSVAVKQGDFFGLLLTNTGSTSGRGLIPYTDDTWANQNFPDGSIRYQMDYITMFTQPSPKVVPPVGLVQLNFDNVGFRTYSFEFKAK